jgi:hypothetical protein
LQKLFSETLLLQQRGQWAKDELEENLKLKKKLE